MTSRQSTASRRLVPFARRTLAMRAYIAAYVLLLGLLTYLWLSVAGVVPRMGGPEGNAPVAVLLVVTAIFGLLFCVVIVAAARWRGARRRKWFWLAGAIPALLFFGPDVSKLADALTRPNRPLLFGLAMLIGLGALIVTAVVSFRDAGIVQRSDAPDDTTA